MAIQVHGVTSDIVLDELPGSLSMNITENSANLNTVTIERWIEDGAGIFNSILESKGINEDGLTENATRVIRAGIISYVAAKIYRKGDYTEETIVARVTEFNEARDRVMDFPEVLGESSSATAQIKSNVDVTIDATDSFGTLFKF